MKKDDLNPLLHLSYLRNRDGESSLFISTSGSTGGFTPLTEKQDSLFRERIHQLLRELATVGPEEQYIEDNL